MKDFDTNFKNSLATSVNLAHNYNKWSRANATVVGARLDAINRECASIETELKLLQNAANRRMCVGVFGASQAGKTYLVNSMASKPGKQLMAVVGQETVPFIGRMNPASRGEETTGVATRFTTVNNAKDQNFPIEIELLSEMDVAKILCNSYYFDLSDGVQKSFGANEIEAVLAASSFDTGSQDYDLGYDILNYLEKTLFPSVFNSSLAAFPHYIKRISEVLETGDLQARSEIYALFWGQDKYFTKIFVKLAEALESLGNVETCYSSMSVFDNENVLMVNALQSILTDTQVKSTVLTTSGLKVELDHSTLSALIAELHVVIDEPSSNLFERADLLDFPGARTRESADQVTKANAGKLLIRGKVAYLFDRYLSRRELTSMLLCIGDSVQDVGELSGLVKKWIQLTHGDTASSRAKMETGLFVVLTKADFLFKKPVSGAGENIQSRFNASFEKFVGSGDEVEDSSEGTISWKAEWAPGKPFNNTYWLRNAGMATNGIVHTGEEKTPSFKEEKFDESYNDLWSALSDAIHNSDEANEMFSEPSRAWDEMMKLNDGGRSYLLGQVEKLCHPDFKLRQLEREFLEFRTQLSNLIREFFADGDVERLYHERLSSAQSIAQPHLQECGKQHKFGEFLKVCYIPEDEVKKILRKLDRGEYGSDQSFVSDQDDEDIWNANAFGGTPEIDGTSDSPASKSLEINDHFSELVFNRWSEILDQVSQNSEVLKYFPIPQEKMIMLFDEIRAGARREQLSSKIADKARNASIFPRSSDKMIPHKARIAAQIVNEFVNHLGVETTNVTLEPGKTIFSRPSVKVGEVLQLPQKSKNFAFEAAFQWALAFVEMTALNARDVNGLENVDIAANESLGVMIGELDSLSA